MGFIFTVLGYGVLSVAMSVYATLLIILRAKLFKTRLYKPMLLNIALAWLPVIIMILGITLLLVSTNFLHTLGVWVLAVIVLIFWLLFFPNAPYLITELNFSHRKKDDKVPLYFDIVHTLSLTTTGLFVGQFSLILVHLLLIIMVSPGYDKSGLLIIPGVTWLFVAICIYLAGFAIYLGRNIRVNSWDILHPLGFIKRLINHLRDKSERKSAYGYIIFYGTFLAIMHVVFFGIIQAQLLVIK